MPAHLRSVEVNNGRGHTSTKVANSHALITDNPKTISVRSIRDLQLCSLIKELKCLERHQSPHAARATGRTASASICDARRSYVWHMPCYSRPRESSGHCLSARSACKLDLEADSSLRRTPRISRVATIDVLITVISGISCQRCLSSLEF